MYLETRLVFLKYYWSTLQGNPITQTGNDIPNKSLIFKEVNPIAG